MTSEQWVKVWDLPTRVFHWLLVISFFIAYLTEDDWLRIHVYSGYFMLSLLVFRIVWGFVGNEYARFSQFVCHPKRSIEYVNQLRDGVAKRYLGHNPAGATMIVVLLLCLFCIGVSGLVVYGAKGHGIFAFINHRHEYLFEKIHELFANFTLGLVGVHILGVIVESIIHRENLVRAMFHGNKRQ